MTLAPTGTSADQALTKRLDDLTAQIKSAATKEQINESMRKAAEGPFKGIIEYAADPLVSSDIVGNPAAVLLLSANATVTRCH